MGQAWLHLTAVSRLQIGIPGKGVNGKSKNLKTEKYPSTSTQRIDFFFNVGLFRDKIFIIEIFLFIKFKYYILFKSWKYQIILTMYMWYQIFDIISSYLMDGRYGSTCNKVYTNDFVLEGKKRRLHLWALAFSHLII